MSAPDRKQTPTLASATYAAEHGRDVLSRAASTLFLLVDAIKKTAEDDAGTSKAMWADALTFVAHGLIDGEEFIEDWLRPVRPGEQPSANDQA